MPAALEGIRVLDLTSGPAGGLATMHLADFGAEVLLIERPERSALDELAAAPMWGRGKRTLPLDLARPEDLERLHALCAGADVLVCSWRASALARRGLDFDAVHARHPHLVYCHISGFGNHGPMADVPGYEHVVAAYAGRMNLFAGITDRPGPVFSALQVTVHACAQTAVAGTMAALLERGANGAGRLVETSMLQALLAYEQGAMIGTQLEALGTQYTVLTGGGEPPMPSLYYHPAQAGDGRWLQFGNLLPHLFDNFLRVTDLVDVIADPDFDAAQLALPAEKHEAFRERMLRRIQQRPAAEWMADFVADGGVVATAYQTTQQALDDPDIVANGHVIARPDGGRQLGPLARLSATPAAPGPPATPDTKLAGRWLADPRPVPARKPAGEAPLAGIRVVEIATIIAAPLGASLLADLGAEVVKVEQLGGDPYRGLAAGVGAARVNAGKKSLSVDLKAPAGREAVLKLIGGADALIHNFRPGVPERLGIGYEQIRAINPDVVYLQCNGYGPDGPGAHRPSTHPIPGAAMGGALYQLGERVPDELQDMDGLRLWTRRLMRANELNPDPNTAMVVASATVLGLLARQRTGLGQQILVDMLGANAQANHDDFLSYPGKPGRALQDAQLHGLTPAYRLYRCADDHWVFLALVSRHERERFVTVLHAAGIDCPGAEELEANDKALAGRLTELFAGKPSAFWQDLSAGAGIACVRADGPLPSRFWLDDPQVAGLGLTTVAEHPRWGAYRRHGPLVRFDRVEPDLGPPPLAGQHNHEVLEALGLDAPSIAQLAADGVIWAEEAP